MVHRLGKQLQGSRTQGSTSRAHLSGGVRPGRLQSLVLSAAELPLRQLTQLPSAAVSNARNIASGSNGGHSAAAPATAAASSMGSAAAEAASKTL